MGGLAPADGLAADPFLGICFPLPIAISIPSSLCNFIILKFLLNTAYSIFVDFTILFCNFMSVLCLFILLALLLPH